ncbi:MAG: right-handed parallel beta-helix repeat-containing protein [Planctomycetota bacterium]
MRVKHEVIYLWPPAGVDINNINNTAQVLVDVPNQNNLFVLDGASHITISGFKFTEVYGLDAVIIKNSSYCTFSDNEIYAPERRGLTVIVYDGQDCNNIVIERNTISYAGDSGIYVGGSVKSSSIVNNHIHHCADENKYCAGIEFPFYGITASDVNEYAYTDDILIAHNWIHDMPRDGIQLGANP